MLFGFTRTSARVAADVIFGEVPDRLGLVVHVEDLTALHEQLSTLESRRGAAAVSAALGKFPEPPETVVTLLRVNFPSLDDQFLPYLVVRVLVHKSVSP